MCECVFCVSLFMSHPANSRKDIAQDTAQSHDDVITAVKTLVTQNCTGGEGRNANTNSADP